MGLLGEFFEVGGKAGAKAAKGLLQETPGVFKRVAGIATGVGIGFLGGNAAVAGIEAGTGRDLPGGADVLGRTLGGFGDAVGGGYGSFTARAASSAAKSGAEGLATGLGLPQGSGSLLLLGLGAVLVLQLVKD